MVWIEMSKDEKLKGKAAVDLLGSQVSLTEYRHFLPLSPSVSGSLSIDDCVNVYLTCDLRFQVGKSGGAWVTQLALLLTGSIATALPIISAVFM